MRMEDRVMLQLKNDGRELNRLGPRSEHYCDPPAICHCLFSALSETAMLSCNVLVQSGNPSLYPNLKSSNLLLGL